MKRIIMALLCMAMVFSTVACKKNPSGSKTTSDSSDAVSGGEVLNDESTGEDISSGSSDASADGSAGVNGGSNGAQTSQNGNSAKVTVTNNCYSSGFPIAKNKVTLKIMIKDHSNGLAKYNNSAFAKYIEEKMNIKLDFKPVSVDAVQQNMSLAYSSNQLPDMFWGMAPAINFHNTYIKQNKVTELGPLIEKYAPNVKKMFQEKPAARYLTTFEDNKTYMIPYVSDPVLPNYSSKLFINKTWLNRVGAKMPTTTAELRNVLIKFRDQDANGNGNKSDEIPMIFPVDVPPSIFGPFGIPTYFDYISVDQKTNKVVYAPTTNEYRNGLRYLADLYSNKLLYNGYQTTSESKLKEWTSSSVPTVGVFSTTGGYSEGVSAENYLKHYALIPPLKGPDAASSTWSYVETENYWAEWCVMPKACKYPEIAMRLIDYLYSPEGTLVALQGPAGANNAWNYQNGKYVPNYSKLPAGKSMTEWTYSFTPGYPIPHYASKAYAELTKYTPTSNLTQNQKAEALFHQSVKTMFANVKPKYVMPKLSFTSQEKKQMANATDTSVNFVAYAGDMRHKFIKGSANLNNDWDNYVAQLNNKCGVASVMQTYNQAYLRYRVWMKNNG